LHLILEGKKPSHKHLSKEILSVSLQTAEVRAHANTRKAGFNKDGFNNLFHILK